MALSWIQIAGLPPLQQARALDMQMIRATAIINRLSARFQVEGYSNNLAAGITDIPLIFSMDGVSTERVIIQNAFVLGIYAEVNAAIIAGDINIAATIDSVKLPSSTWAILNNTTVGQRVMFPPMYQNFKPAPFDVGAVVTTTGPLLPAGTLDLRVELLIAYTGED